MITYTLEERKVTGGKIQVSRRIKLCHSIDKARKEIAPIVREMEEAKKMKREPKVRIAGVSYDSDSEKMLLLELRAITTTENE